jgi:MoxR-like ATPase
VAEAAVDIKHLTESVDNLKRAFDEHRYICSDQIATAVYLAYHLHKPILIEGPPGVGKTELAKTTAELFELPLIRLQCYEGLDVSSAVYEWNYSRQMIEIRLAEAKGNASRKALESDIFSERFLIRRPLLQALEYTDAPPVLLIDELDRSDEPFEAYLLEVLADYQVTIPEIGTVRAEQPPIVIMTSNRTREIHDAVKRRCLYHWVDYPDAAAELDIIRRKAPRAQEILSREIVAFVQKLRSMDLFKLPGVAETIDWANAMVELDRVSLEAEIVNDTLGALLKYQDDVVRVRGDEAARILSDIRAELAHSH